MPGTNKAARLQPEKHRRQRGGSSAPCRCPPASPSVRAPHRAGGTNLQQRLPGERGGPWATQRRAWERSWAVPARRCRGDAAGERQGRAELVPLAGGGSRKEGGR
ncbi:unnamed protein product [Coccothraustes coccothraustes]